MKVTDALRNALERIEKLEGAIFGLALAVGRLDVLQDAGYEITLTDVTDIEKDLDARTQ